MHLLRLVGGNSSRCCTSHKVSGTSTAPVAANTLSHPQEVAGQEPMHQVCMGCNLLQACKQRLLCSHRSSSTHIQESCSNSDSSSARHLLLHAISSYQHSHQCKHNTTSSASSYSSHQTSSHPCSNSNHAAKCRVTQTRALQQFHTVPSITQMLRSRHQPNISHSHGSSPTHRGLLQMAHQSAVTCPHGEAHGSHLPLEPQPQRANL